MTTKIQLINDAYSQLRISGLTVNPTPAMLTKALDRMDSMMAQWFTAWNIDIGYNFDEEPPDFNSVTNVPRAWMQTIITNLAVRLIPDFNKQVPPELKTQASLSLTLLIGQIAAANLRPLQASTRMPRGSGNTLRTPVWNRYNVPTPLPPVSASTHYMLQGEQLDYMEDFSAFLGAATIASWQIASDPLLVIVAASQTDAIINYTILAPTQPPNTYGPFQQVEIKITDSLGRVEIRLVNFGVSTPPVVPNIFTP